MFSNYCLRLTLVLVCFCGFSFTQATAQLVNTGDDFHDKLIQFGSGPLGGSFEPIANTLCDSFNEARKKTSIRCIPIRTAGSVFNIHAVANGSLQLALAQEDLISEALTDAKGENSLRAVALMHNSFVGILVRRMSGITELSQINRGIVNVGKKGSGTYLNAMSVLKALDLDESDLAGVRFFDNSDFETAFCEGNVDVFFNAIAHPSDLYKRLRACGGEFLDIPDDIIKKLMAQNSSLKQMNIPAGIYGPEQKIVKTLGMRNLLISNKDIDETAIFRFTNLLYEKYKSLQKKQPYLESMRLLLKEDINSLALPLHPGALRAIEFSKQ